MNYLRSRSLKRLLSLGRRSNNSDESNDECVFVVDQPPPSNKPTWRCFSYEEVNKATNGFHRGTVDIYSCWFLWGFGIENMAP
jgi:hypothetical protein